MKKHKEGSTKLRNMKNDQEISTNINKHKRGTGGQSARCLPNALKPFRYYVNTMWKRHEIAVNRNRAGQ